MIETVDIDAPDVRPLHVRIAEERVRRDWTQEDVAARAGMSLRAYHSFENGKTRPQGKNMRAILKAFDMDESGEDRRDATLESWPPDIEVFLDMMGAFLSTMPDAERLSFMHDTTRRIVSYR